MKTATVVALTAHLLILAVTALLVASQQMFSAISASLAAQNVMSLRLPFFLLNLGPESHCRSFSPAGCTFVSASEKQVCRESAGECDMAETCSGSSGDCPVDEYVAAGVPCTDLSFGKAGACHAGQCRSVTNECATRLQFPVCRVVFTHIFATT